MKALALLCGLLGLGGCAHVITEEVYYDDPPLEPGKLSVFFGGAIEPRQVATRRSAATARWRIQGVDRHSRVPFGSVRQEALGRRQAQHRSQDDGWHRQRHRAGGLDAVHRIR